MVAHSIDPVDGLVSRAPANVDCSVYLILAVWIAENQLSSVVFDLAIREHYSAGMLKEDGESPYCRNDKHIYSTAFAQAEHLKDKRALAWMNRLYTFQALGKVGWDEEYPTIVDMVEQQGNVRDPYLELVC